MRAQKHTVPMLIIHGICLQNCRMQIRNIFSEWIQVKMHQPDMWLVYPASPRFLSGSIFLGMMSRNEPSYHQKEHMGCREVKGLTQIFRHIPQTMRDSSGLVLLIPAATSSIIRNSQFTVRLAKIAF